MTQSRYSVLVSLCLLLLLTAGFFLASRAIFAKLHSSVDAAIATSTATAVIQATPTLSVQPTPKGHHTTHAAPTNTPQPAAGQVVANISASMSNPLTTIPSDTNQVFCVSDLPSVPSGTTMVYHFQKLSTPGDYYTQPVTASGGVKFAYIYGPLQPGQWRCLVEVGTNVVGSVQFTIH
jgi:hypothetical protein